MTLITFKEDRVKNEMSQPQSYEDLVSFLARKFIKIKNLDKNNPYDLLSEYTQKNIFLSGINVTYPDDDTILLTSLTKFSNRLKEFDYITFTIPSGIFKDLTIKKIIITDGDDSFQLNYPYIFLLSPYEVSFMFYEGSMLYIKRDKLPIFSLATSEIKQDSIGEYLRVTDKEINIEGCQELLNKTTRFFNSNFFNIQQGKISFNISGVNNFYMATTTNDSEIGKIRPSNNVSAKPTNNRFNFDGITPTGELLRFTPDGLELFVLEVPNREENTIEVLAKKKGSNKDVSYSSLPAENKATGNILSNTTNKYLYMKVL
jgi:hypothetical protein